MSQEAVTKRKPFVVGKIMPKKPKVGHIRLVIDILFFHPFHDAQLALTNGRMVDGFLAHKNAFAATFLGKVAVVFPSFLPSFLPGQTTHRCRQIKCSPLPFSLEVVPLSSLHHAIRCQSNISIGWMAGDLSFMKAVTTGEAAGRIWPLRLVPQPSSNNHLILKERAAGRKEERPLLLGRLKWLNLGDHDNGKSWPAGNVRVAPPLRDTTQSDKDDDISRETELSATTT